MGVTDPKVFIDHIDGNGLNNQRNNLRIATASQNGANRKSTNKTSSYLGVCKHKDRNSKYTCWKAECRKDGQRYYKYHKSEIEAALWYNEKARELHGEFAKLNNIKTIKQ